MALVVLTDTAYRGYRDILTEQRREMEEELTKLHKISAKGPRVLFSVLVLDSRRNMVFPVWSLPCPWIIFTYWQPVGTGDGGNCASCLNTLSAGSRKVPKSRTFFWAAYQLKSNHLENGLSLKLSSNFTFLSSVSEENFPLFLTILPSDLPSITKQTFGWRTVHFRGMKFLSGDIDFQNK